MPLCTSDGGWIQDGDCCDSEYTDPYYGYYAVQSYQQGPFDPEVSSPYTCNYKQYCFDIALECFGGCSGAPNPGCSNYCKDKLRKCCGKIDEFEFDNEAGNICGADSMLEFEENGYYECNCGNRALWTDNAVVPPKYIKIKRPNITRDGTPGGSAPNKLRRNMTKKTKCAHDEVRLPTGVCSKARTDALLRTNTPKKTPKKMW